MTATHDALAETIPLRFELNGREVEALVAPGARLLDVLRGKFDAISPKNGCQPLGQCGCCTVLVNGRPMVSCVVPAEKADGKSVITLEGFDQDEAKLLAECFHAAGGLQCGFCIPGIAVRAKAIVDKNPECTRDEIRRGLMPHLCRCTGYKKIEDAIELYRDARTGARRPEFDTSGKVGTGLPRYLGQDFVLGRKRYVDDIKVDGMLHGALRFSDHPRAKVLRVDIAAALEVPGVVRVATAADVPGRRVQGLIYKDWPVLVAEGETVNCQGDVLAAVAAETPEAARAAADAVVVEYEVLPPVHDMVEAAKPGSPVVHPVLHPEGNVLSEAVIRRGEGDFEEALAACAHVVHETFETQRIEHLFLEPESALAIPAAWFDSHPPTRPSNGSRSPLPRYGWFEGPSNPACKLHLLSQSQGVFDDRRQVASLLGLADEEVQVELLSNGGGFGGKEDLSVQGQAALLAHLAQRPVKITLSRLESVRLHPKRHPLRMEYWLGCDERGVLKAVKARMIGDTGAYASVGTKVLERAAGHACGPYRVPHVDVRAVCVYTNNVPCGAMRGFGVNQAAWGVEQCLDLLAERVGVDRWTMRYQNALEDGDFFSTGQRLEGGVGLKKTLEAVKEQFLAAKHAGIACGIKNTGIGNGMPDSGEAVVRVERWDDGAPGIAIHSGFTEMGQGLLTIMIQALCEVAPVDSQRVRVVIDTSHPTPCGMTTASRATVLAGHAVRLAGEKLAADLAGSPLEALVGESYMGEWTYDETVPLGTLRGKDGGPPKTHLAFSYATQVAIMDDEGNLAKIIAAHDVGRVMNRLACEGQIEGSIHMGMGYALTEDCPSEGGELQVKDLRTFGVLRAHQMPEMEVILVEEPDPNGPWGAKGVGEIGLVPTAPAIAGALRTFDGVLRTKLPMKDTELGARLFAGKA